MARPLVHPSFENTACLKELLRNVRTPVHRAATAGEIEEPKTLFEGLIPQEKGFSKGITPLHSAVIERNVEVIKKLVMDKDKIDCDLNCCMLSDDNLILRLALSQNDLTSIKALIKYATLRRNLLQEIGKNPREIIDLQEYSGMRNYPLAFEYKNNCEDEIRRMRSEKLTDSLTLFRMISATYLHPLYKDSERVELFTERLIEVITGNSYPLYCDVIIEQIIDKVHVSDLIKKLCSLQISSVSICSDEKESTLNPDINYVLAKYLSKNDLLNLILASSKPTTDNIISNFQFNWMTTSMPFMVDESFVDFTKSRLFSCYWKMNYI